MKTTELSMGEKHAIVKLREDGTSIRAIAQTLAVWAAQPFGIYRRRKKPLVCIVIDVEQVNGSIMN